MRSRAAALAAGLALLPLLAACSTLPRVRRPERPPNIVLILADDLGYGELGCYGQEKIRTPRLDRLAREGLRFTRHYSGSPVCAPARCTLLTGLHTGHAYIRGNDEVPERGDVWHDPELEGQRPLPEGTVTLAHLLREAGYATAFVGKWGLGWTGSSGDPNRQGFDHFFGYICQREAHNYYPDHLWCDGRKVPLRNEWFFPHQKLPEGVDPADPASYPDYRGRDYAPDLMIEDALEWIRAHRDGPFFLEFASPLPHLALQVPDADLARYAGAFPEVPYPGGQGYLPHPTPRAAYAAMISRLDRDVGRILDLLEELGLAEDTLVVFTSDNGPSWVGGVDLEFFGSQGGLRGRKAHLWEGGIRVPCIVRWPGRTPAGAVTDLPTAFWDWLPTLCDVAGGAVPVPTDGISLRPLLEGRPAAQPRHRFLYWEFRGAQAVLLDGRWKAFRPSPDKPVQLYDLEADPAEARDVAEAHPEIVARSREVMTREHMPSELFPLPGEAVGS